MAAGCSGISRDLPNLLARMVTSALSKSMSLRSRRIASPARQAGDGEQTDQGFVGRRLQREARARAAAISPAMSASEYR